jgi:hypothetical protein
MFRPPNPGGSSDVLPQRRDMTTCRLRSLQRLIVRASPNPSGRPKRLPVTLSDFLLSTSCSCSRPFPEPLSLTIYAPCFICNLWRLLDSCFRLDGYLTCLKLTLSARVCLSSPPPSLSLSFRFFFLSSLSSFLLHLHNQNGHVPKVNAPASSCHIKWPRLFAIFQSY